MAKIVLKDLTLEELAALENISYRVVAKYENESRLAGLETVEGQRIYESFQEKKKLYDKVFEEMEKRLEDIK